MTTTPYYLLPPERTWPSDIETCALALIDGADGQRNIEAALALLFRDPTQVIFRADIADQYIHGIWPAHVHWRQLFRAAAVRGHVALEDDERAAIMLACSMADQSCLTRWADYIPDLDVETRRAWIDAMAYLAEVTR